MVAIYSTLREICMCVCGRESRERSATIHVFLIRCEVVWFGELLCDGTIVRCCHRACALVSQGRRRRKSRPASRTSAESVALREGMTRTRRFGSWHWADDSAAPVTCCVCARNSIMRMSLANGLSALAVVRGIGRNLLSRRRIVFPSVRSREDDDQEIQGHLDKGLNDDR